MDTTAYIKLVEEVERRARLGGRPLLSSTEAVTFTTAVRELVAERELILNEITTGFDVIFPYVIEANDADGASLSLADKIQILGSTLDAVIAEHNRLAEELAQVRAALATEDKSHRLSIKVFQQQQRIWSQKYEEQDATLAQVKARLLQGSDGVGGDWTVDEIAKQLEQRLEGER